MTQSTRYSKRKIWIFRGSSLPTAFSQEIEVEALKVFCVHETPSTAEARTSPYSITHIPSGTRITLASGLSQARAITEYLEDAELIPPMAAPEVPEWMRENPETVAQVKEQIALIKELVE